MTKFIRRKAEEPYAQLSKSENIDDPGDRDGDDSSTSTGMSVYMLEQTTVTWTRRQCSLNKIGNTVCWRGTCPTCGRSFSLEKPHHKPLNHIQY